MALPLIIPSIAGAVVSGLVTFVMSRIGTILLALGFTFVGVKGMETFIGFVISDLNQIMAYSSSVGGTGAASGLASKMVKLAAFAGLFDAVNIVISGYLTFAAMLSLRFVLARLSNG